MKTVGFVTIRLNSTRVPQKNIKPLGAKPMCWYMVNTLLQVKEIDEVYVFCSDPAVMEYVPPQAIFLQRDKRLDGDEIMAKDIFDALITKINADIYVWTNTTSPFTRPETVRTALNSVKSGEYDSAFTVKRAQTFAWHKGEPINCDPADIPRTQVLEPVFLETSALYVFKNELWTQHKRRIGFNPYMVEVDNIEAIDIDEPDDFEFANLVANVLTNFHSH